MKVHTFSGRTLEEAKDKAIHELKKKETDLIIKTKEEEMGLFKGKKYDLEVIVLDELISFVKKFLITLLKNMNIKCNIETRRRDGILKIIIYSDNNAILIGKNGKTLQSIQVMVKQAIHKEIGIYINLVVDIENYKERQKRGIEKLAKQIAEEVIKTKVDAKMDSMTSYERRVVHNILTEYEEIYTESEGEEPNRYIVIKYNGR